MNLSTIGFQISTFEIFATIDKPKYLNERLAELHPTRDDITSTFSLVTPTPKNVTLLHIYKMHDNNTLSFSSNS